MNDIASNPRCDACNGTGWYGDNGPGIAGNREYMPCDYCNIKPEPKQLMTKVYNALKILANVSGVPEKEVDSIWEQVKANQEKLNDCKLPHNFISPNGDRAARKYFCSKCDGELDRINVQWYERGLEDGKK